MFYQNRQQWVIISGEGEDSHRGGSPSISPIRQEFGWWSGRPNGLDDFFAFEMERGSNKRISSSSALVINA